MVAKVFELLPKTNATNLFYENQIKEQKSNIREYKTEICVQLPLDQNKDHTHFLSWYRCNVTFVASYFPTLSTPTLADTHTHGTTEFMYVCVFQDNINLERQKSWFTFLWMFPYMSDAMHLKGEKKWFKLSIRYAAWNCNKVSRRTQGNILNYVIFWHYLNCLIFGCWMDLPEARQN